MPKLFLLALALTLAAAAPAAQPAPEGVVTRAGETEVVVHWDPVEGASGYVVLRDGVEIGRPPDNHWVDRTTAQGTPYAYAVRAIVSGAEGDASAAETATTGPLTDDAFIDLVQALAFDYFWYEADPETGMVRDRSQPGSAASIAAVGFGLTAYGIGVERGWITRDQARARTLATLRNLWTTPQGTATSGVSGYRGFFYHFLEMDTGLRQGTNELSTVDTALLMAGVLYAGEYFDGADADEAEIRQLARDLDARVEWDWSQGGTNGIQLGWFPESGFISIPWQGYNEGMIVYLMGLGSDTHPSAPQWGFWLLGYDFITAYGYEFIAFPPLFGHQYTHAWVDFRGIQDRYTRERGLDYFENSRRATLAQRAYAIDNPQNHPNYGADEWGFTASDDPVSGYAVHGAPPAVNDNGTITPTAPGGSIAFAPTEATEALRTMYRKYPNSLWDRYGFRDAYNIRRGWFARDYLGIDQGPFVLMIENLRTGHVWDVMDGVETLQRGLARAGFEQATAGADGPDAPLALAVGPSPAAGAVRVRFELAAPAAVRLAVYDVLGREVAVLAEGHRAAGPHAATWAGGPAGTYLVRLDAGGRTATRAVTRSAR